jgi:3-hydroxyisobutyrate dehydrogenase-like beta-hydroxyacid dehydrogenase
MLPIQHDNEPQTNRLNIGFIGLGIMGRPMALNLCRAGYRLHVYARNPEQSAPLQALGATVLATPRAVAHASNILFINVSDDAALESVLFGPDAATEGLRTDSIVVDMGTTSPTYTRELGKRLMQYQVSLIDAPVSGGEAGAIAGTLSIMAGGTAAAFQRVLPLFQVIGGSIVHVGDCGAGQIAKACNQIAVSATLMGVAEALTFAQCQGIDASKVRQALLGGSAYSKILEIHGQRMLERNYQPGFKAKLHHKDLSIVETEAQLAGLTLPATAFAAELMKTLANSGDNQSGGELDSSALIEIIQSKKSISATKEHERTRKISDLLKLRESPK